MSNIFDCFFVINLDSREDRLREFGKENIRATRISAIEDKDRGLCDFIGNLTQVADYHTYLLST